MADKPTLKKLGGKAKLKKIRKPKAEVGENLSSPNKSVPDLLEDSDSSVASESEDIHAAKHFLIVSSDGSEEYIHRSACERFDLRSDDREFIGKEVDNYVVGDNLCTCLRGLLRDEESPLSLDACLFADRVSIASNNEASPDFVDHDVHHREDCDECSQLRRVLMIRGDWLLNWEPSIEALSALFTVFISQHHMLDNDCCPQVSLISRSRQGLDLLANKAMSFPVDVRIEMLMNMDGIGDLPKDMKRSLAGDLIPKKQSYAAIAAEPNIMKKQLMIPDNSDDLSEASLVKWLKYTNDCVSSNQELRIDAWSDDFKTHVNNRWGAREEIVEVNKRSAWQRKTAKEIIDLLKSFLPAKHPLSRKTTVGRLPIDVFHEYLLNNPIVVDFRGTLSEDNPFYSDSTKLQIQWDHCLKEGDRPSSDKEKHFAKELVKKLTIVGAADLSKNQMLSDIKQACLNTNLFIDTLEEIKTIVLAKFKMLNSADKFWADEKAPGKRSHVEDRWIDTPRGKKRLQPATFAAPKSAPGGVPPLCEKCGWNKKANIVPGQNFSCPRGPDQKGCGDDDRRNTTSTPWKSSEVGKMWKECGYSSLPKDTTVTLANAKERFQKWEKPDAKADAKNKPKGWKKRDPPKK